MPIFIRHRVNQISELDSIDKSWGVEIDLRSHVAEPAGLHLSHDPWVLGDRFKEWLDAFGALQIKGPLILNTKEDGLEETAMGLLAQRGLENFFFLDAAMPTLVRFVREEMGQYFAVRASAMEPIEGLRAFVGKVQWVWLDCFEGVPVDLAMVEQIKKHFRICMVSPELQKKSIESISDFKKIVPFADAICTKSPELLSKKLRES